MFLAAAVVIGVSLTSWLLFISGRYLHRRGEANGFLQGFKTARDEYQDTIRAQTMKLIRYESEFREPKEGFQEWVVDFNQEPVAMERGKILKINRYLHGITVDFQRPSDEQPLTGTIIHTTVIIPESAQEC